MEEKYLSAQMVLKKAGQEQLLDCYNIFLPFDYLPLTVFCSI